MLNVDTQPRLNLAFVAPLADDAVEVRSHRVNHDAGTATVAVLALRFPTGGPASAVVHDGVVALWQGGREVGEPVLFEDSEPIC